MKDDKIDAFLEKTNMNYLFCLLSKLEGQRISNFPPMVRQTFSKKLGVIAMEHVASNDVPDYLEELEEAERILAQKLAEAEEDDDDIQFTQETYDDSERYTQGVEEEIEVPNPFGESTEHDPFGDFEEDEEDFDAIDDFDDDDDDDE